MIHDSFGVLAPDYTKMAKAVREAFCEVYEQDVLKNWADEMYAMLSPKNQRKFPPLPVKGNLVSEGKKIVGLLGLAPVKHHKKQASTKKKKNGSRSFQKSI